MDLVSEKLSGFLGEDRLDAVKTRSIYRVHQRVAETFRQGRVCLLGDAAHINNPTAGMGMNSGIHDAHVLASAISSYLEGGAEGDLDQYAESRRDYALASVRSYTDAQYKAMAASDPTVRLARNTELADIAKDPERCRNYLLRASMLEERIPREEHHR